VSLKLETYSDLIAWNVSNYTIAFKTIYVDITGDLVAGLLLSQVIYWFLPGEGGKSKLRVERDGRMWLCKSRFDWKDEIRITERQYDRAAAILVNLNIVDVETFKFAGTPKTHIAVNFDTLLSLLNENLTQYTYDTNIPIIKQPKKVPSSDIYRKFKHLSMTEEEFEKLRIEYSKEQIDEVLNDLENYRKNTNYVSMYKTALKWLKKRHDKGNKNIDIIEGFINE